MRTRSGAVHHCVRINNNLTQKERQERSLIKNASENSVKQTETEDEEKPMPSTVNKHKVLAQGKIDGPLEDPNKILQRSHNKEPR